MGTEYLLYCSILFRQYPNNISVYVFLVVHFCRGEHCVYVCVYGLYLCVCVRMRMIVVYRSQMANNNHTIKTYTTQICNTAFEKELGDVAPSRTSPAQHPPTPPQPFNLRFIRSWKTFCDQDLKGGGVTSRNHNAHLEGMNRQEEEIKPTSHAL